MTRDTSFAAVETRISDALDAHAIAAGSPFRHVTLALEEWDGDIWLGGLTSHIGTDWLLVDLVAVADAARGRGVGKRLMAGAEAHARKLGLVGISLDTLSFQAPDFYPPLGYREVGRVVGYPLGGYKVFLEKRLPSDLRRLIPGDPALAQVLALLHREFAYMDSKIDPPSSLAAMTPSSLSKDARTSEVWALGDPVAACMILTPKEDALYLGKLAVATSHRGQGIARRMIDLAVARAPIHKAGRIELQTRVELTANQALFRALGFTEVARTAHPGYDRPTAITFERKVQAP
jgi:ribosomal protein S18 acetylase RimI-like enzyme